MSLARGTRIGSYDVVEQIGAGGMGEVYRARDHRLDREVALKVLPVGLAGDADRLARLQREARTLATLNHPNIAQIHGLEESNGLTALVMELVEGLTLADRIARGPLPIDEALPIARQIADALEAAHEQGIVHRDLKPANIKVRSDGSVKVLDFGLARAVDPTGGLDSSRLPTLTSPAMMTGAGVVLGTAAYMSPEQAKGRPVDRRADIWAFGVVLAEMLSGRAMFAGESVTETLASVMRDAPTIPDAPPAIRHLLRRCLERDPRLRLRDIGEARIVLEDPASVDAGHAVAGAAGVAPVTRRPGGLAAALALTAIVAGAAAWMLRPEPSADTPLRKFTIPVEELQAGILRSPHVSPDGTRLVYVAGGRLVLRDFASLEPRELTTAADPRYPTWSPDGTQLAYIAGDRIWKVAVAGGAPSVVTILRQPLGNGVGMAWTPEGRIVLTTAMPGMGLQQVSAEGGDLTTLLAPEAPGEQDFHEVHLLPEGHGLLYALDRGAGVVDTIVVFADGAKKTVLHLENESLRAPMYAATGHILYERTTNNAGIWALPFSLSTLEATGEPFLVAPQSTLPSVSRDGTLIFMPQAPQQPSELIILNADGKVVSTLGQPMTGLATPNVSHDGRRVAASAITNARLDVWIYDVMRGNRTRLTFGEGDELAYAWSPSDDRVFFLQRVPPAQSRTIVEQAVDGTGTATEVVASRNATALDVSRDSRFLVYSDGGREPAKTGQDLWYVRLDGERKPALFVEAPTAQGDPRFSPDGRFLAYVSNESGRPEVYLKPFPTGDGKWQVSVNGGTAPRWSERGDVLFFIEPGSDAKAFAASITTAPALTIDTPRVLFTASAIGRRLAGVGWDVFPDGKRFVVIGEVPGTERQIPAITVVQNWFAEFRARH